MPTSRTDARSKPEAIVFCALCGGLPRYDGAPFGVAGRICRVHYDSLRGVRRKVELRPSRGGPPPEPTEAEAARVLAACQGVADAGLYPSEDRVKRHTRGIPIRVAMALRRGFLAAGAIDLSAVAILPGEGEPAAVERLAIAARWAEAREAKARERRVGTGLPHGAVAWRVARAAEPDFAAEWRTKR